MGTLSNDTWTRVQDAAVAIVATRGETGGDLAVAQRILRAVGSVYPRQQVRLVFLEGELLVCFGIEGFGEHEAPQSLGCLSRSPFLQQWIRQLATGGAMDGLPTELSELLSLGSHPTGFAPLLAGGGVAGLIALGEADHSLADAAQALALLGTLAGASLENARLLRRLQYEAVTDGLTGAYNYRHLMRRIDEEIERTRRHGSPFSVLMVDVDNLKEYNDQFGHLGGSAALRELAQVLTQQSRGIDVVAKYGGDEFGVLLPETAWPGAVTYAQRVVDRVAAHHFENDSQRRLTISAGIAVHPDEGSSAKGILQKADERLFEAKSDGRNRVGRTPQPQ
jgi:diguanylate cyclase (GGDEF)-like protein